MTSQVSPLPFFCQDTTSTTSPQVKMKRFLPKQKKEGQRDAAEPQAASGNASTCSENDSLHDLRPMFQHETSALTNDLLLNTNPSIYAPSSRTDDSEGASKSLFSSRQSYSTRQSSYMSSRSKKNTSANEMGPALQVFDIPEDKDSEGSPQEALSELLHVLWQDISYIQTQYLNSLLTLSTCVVHIIDCLKDFVAFTDKFESDQEWNFTAYDNSDVRRVLKTYLHLYDNLLKDEAYVRLRLLLCKNFNDFTASLKSSSRRTVSGQNIAKPQNFAIGANDGRPLPRQEAISRIIGRIASSSTYIQEQNGSFIAPIARGTSKDMNVLCLYFGYPNPSENHNSVISNINELYDDVHVLIAKNKIEFASTAASSSSAQLPESLVPASFAPNVPRFKLPFRVPSDSTSPPLSLSVSTESARRVSGTIGGFIYPKIDIQKQPHLSSYAKSKFAISCGHVCLDKREEIVDYPYVSSPSSVLIGLYKQALQDQYQKCVRNEGDQSMLDSKVAYSSVLNQLDEMFPVGKVKTLDPKTKQEKVETRNFPKHRFGQIIWGERTLIQAKRTKDGRQLKEKRLSDLAIIKVNKLLKCDQNYLGDDIAFNEYDPSLIFENLYVRKIILLGRLARDISENLNEVDSMASTQSMDSDGNVTHRGLPVFKYGSTTKFTKGFLNGIKLVYWLDGAIHSSEFVVNSCENTTAFAAGGDSGSWILTKLENVKGLAKKEGLGVVGMLHSYDGEFRQFGLFTPMTEILDRLAEVTKIQWGVVGVQEKGGEIISNYSDSGSELSSDSEDDSEYEDGLEEQTKALQID